MPSARAVQNSFLTAPIGRVFVRNAVPMTLVMAMSGLLTVVDAVFLGRFVGSEALAAVSLAFPAVMVTLALSSLVSGGMASLYARALGAERYGDAGRVFAQAHGLALTVAALLIAGFALVGPRVLGWLSGGQGAIAAQAGAYMQILIWGTPVQFLLGLHADALRSEGRAGLMALLSLSVTLANIALNYGLIVQLGWGVAGSAWGTVVAQGAGLGLLVGFRLRAAWVVPLSALVRHGWARGWGRLLALGAPVSLSFVGMALVSGTVIAVLAGAPEAGMTIAAYGVTTRLLSFAFLPQMAIALATQSIVGNNHGAGLHARAAGALRLAMIVAGVYCVGVELILLAASGWIGLAFVDDSAVVAQVSAILRVQVLLYAASGPVLVLALYFQAVGLPGRTAALTLVKPFLLSPALVIGLAAAFGPGALWAAFPVGDAVVIALALGLWSTGIARKVAP
ncbi:MATE family efflux transporter [Pararhodobacter zhoushanensis]|uniref:Multidrug export protein MepA n=1 Tax=Pararhodobacter zhoushanensis TaxID=2479545 RepID=A0ABT3H397_9RHOB|nr:MATE family efflux transporter [Pararhodobacter zhoushanensis]MCW1934155.1 MATE family efflux transporter [Pararhodobacter zhoushanensis]